MVLRVDENYGFLGAYKGIYPEFGSLTMKFMKHFIAMLNISADLADE